MATISELPSTTAASPDMVPSTEDAATGKEKSNNWRFIESQPIREDQVENAVKFLSHPKVKGSPVVYRRSFLERKGLSREEIDEAFRRVPDPPSDSSSSPIPTAGAVGTVNSPSQGHETGKPGAQATILREASKPTSWAQMLLALGVLTAAGTGAGVFAKKYFIPKFKTWILDIVSGKSSPGEPSKVSRPNPEREAITTAAAAATAAASAATQVAAAMQEIAKSKIEDRKSLDSIIRAVEAQTQELKITLAGMKDAVQNVEVTKYQRPVTNFHLNGGGIDDYQTGHTNGSRPTSAAESLSVTAKQKNFGTMPESSAGNYNTGQVKPVSSSPPNGAVNAPHSQSYLDIMAMLERGEKPPGIREINDKPPNPNQQPSNPRLQPRVKPWEKAALDSQSSFSSGGAETGQHNMLPWEKAALESQASNPGAGAGSGQPGRYDESWNVGSSFAVNTDLTIGSSTSGSSGAWWRKKGDMDAGPGSSAVKITEVDVATEVDIGTLQVGQSSSSSSMAQVSRGRAGWVPPAVPLPVYPGAEEAIRRPKPAAAAVPMRALSGAESVQVASASSSFQKDEAPAQADIPANSVLSNAELPKQHVEVSDEQEPEYLDRTLVESTRTFKDVIQEGDSK